MTYAWEVVLSQSWLQKSVELSTIEAEYMVAVEADKEVIWMKNFIGELGIRQDEFWLYYDSQRAIQLVKNTAYHSRDKHIEEKFWHKKLTDSN